MLLVDFFLLLFIIIIIIYLLLLLFFETPPRGKPCALRGMVILPVQFYARKSYEPFLMFKVRLVQAILSLLVCTLATGRKKGKLEIFPHLAYDNWENGHELPDVVEGRIFSSIIFLRVVNKGKRMIKNVTLAVKESQYIIPSISEVPIDVQGGQRVSVHAPLRQVIGTSIPMDACPFKIL